MTVLLIILGEAPKYKERLCSTLSLTWDVRALNQYLANAWAVFCWRKPKKYSLRRSSRMTQFCSHREAAAVLSVDFCRRILPNDFPFGALPWGTWWSLQTAHLTISRLELFLQKDAWNSNAFMPSAWTYNPTSSNLGILLVWLLLVLAMQPRLAESLHTLKITLPQRHNLLTAYMKLALQLPQSLSQLNAIITRAFLQALKFHK